MDCSLPGSSTHRTLQARTLELGDFPGGPVVKTSPSDARGAGSIPGQGGRIPYTLQPKNQNIKQKQYSNNVNKKTLKMVHIKKIFKK